MDEAREEPIVNIPIYDEGDEVELLAGEFAGSTGKISARQIVDGGWQYGVDGIVPLDLYAVHEHEIKKVAIVPITPAMPSDTGGAEDVSSLLQKASQIAQGRELNTNQALQGILERLAQIDKRMETKEIKVVVEVRHLWDDRGVDDDISQTVTTTTEQLKAGIIAAATHYDHDDQLSLFEEEE